MLSQVWMDTVTAKQSKRTHTITFALWQDSATVRTFLKGTVFGRQEWLAALGMGVWPSAFWGVPSSSPLVFTKMLYGRWLRLLLGSYLACGTHGVGRHGKAAMFVGDVHPAHKLPVVLAVLLAGPHLQVARVPQGAAVVPVLTAHSLEHSGILNPPQLSRHP